MEPSHVLLAMGVPKERAAGALRLTLGFASAIFLAKMLAEDIENVHTGPIEAVRCVLSYLAVKVRPPKSQETLEDYIVANYGRRLFDHFFKTYNEKVWGVPASELSADWGAQRIKGMSIFAAVWEPIRAKFHGHPKGPAQGPSHPHKRPRAGDRPLPGGEWGRVRGIFESRREKGRQMTRDLRADARRRFQSEQGAIRNEIRAVLTVEQQAKFDALLQGGPERMWPGPGRFPGLKPPATSSASTAPPPGGRRCSAAS